MQLVFILPLAAGAACLALSRTVGARWLGLAAAAALAASALVLLLARAGGLPLILLDTPWLALGEQTVRLRLRFDGLNWLFAVVVLLGGALALCALGLALPRDLRGFGGLLAALLLLPLGATATLALDETLLLPLSWMLTAFAGFVALRASGALAGSDAPLLVLGAGGVGALLALGAALLLRATPPGGVAPVALACMLALALLACGAPPLHAPLAAAASAPAALAALVVALGTPLLGGYVLLDYMGAVGPAAPAVWNTALLWFGAFTVVAAASGALATTHLRAIAGWQLSAQAGALLMALGAGPLGLGVAAPALLLNCALTTLTAFLAIAALERRTGDDDLAAPGAGGPFVLPGIALLVAGASAVGVPGTLGFWSRLWLADALAVEAPALLAVLLAGSVLLALSYVAPLAAFWRRASRDDEAPTAHLGELPALVVVLPLLLAGAAPVVLWNGWLAGAARVLVPEAGDLRPALPGTIGTIASGVAAAALVVLPLLVRRRPGRLTPDDDEIQAASVIPPAALGRSVAGLAEVARPAALRQAWEIALRASEALGRGLALFEQRYYLAGLVLALIGVLLVFI
jgi:formate hydrogenlyase subunit 3/multisubunit Na+/H+ antiporter MnhD subunit